MEAIGHDGGQGAGGMSTFLRMRCGDHVTSAIINPRVADLETLETVQGWLAGDAPAGFRLSDAEWWCEERYAGMTASAGICEPVAPRYDPARMYGMDLTTQSDGKDVAS